MPFFDEPSKMYGDAESTSQVPGGQGDGLQTINDNEFVKLQRKLSMQAAMNMDMPMAKGIVDSAFLENHRVVQKRKGCDPLGNFWNQNLDAIFKDF